MSETRRQCVKIIFIIIHVFLIILYHLRNKIMYVLLWPIINALTWVLFWCLFLKLLRTGELNTKIALFNSCECINSLRFECIHYSMCIHVSVIFKLIKNRYLEYFLCSCPQVNAVGPHWWLINICSCKGMVSSDTKLLPVREPRLIQVYITRWHHEATVSQLLSPRTKWPPFHRRCFQMHFREWKVFCFDLNFTEVCSWGSN